MLDRSPIPMRAKRFINFTPWHAPAPGSPVSRGRWQHLGFVSCLLVCLFVVRSPEKRSTGHTHIHTHTPPQKLKRNSGSSITTMPLPIGARSASSFDFPGGVLSMAPCAYLGMNGNPMRAHPCNQGAFGKADHETLIHSLIHSFNQQSSIRFIRSTWGKDPKKGETELQKRTI